MKHSIHVIKSVLTVTVIGISSLSLFAQDPVFSQFYMSPMQLNPALTGITYNPRISLNYRNQWPNMPNAYVTYSAAFDQYIEKWNSGLGVSVVSDIQGDGIYRSTGVTGAYAYNLAMTDKLYMRAGLSAAFVNSRIDWNKLVFLDQLNPLYGAVDASGTPNTSQQIRPSAASVNYADVGMGLLMFSEQFYGGFSLNHVNAPNVSLLGDRNSRGIIPLRFSAHFGGEFFINPHNKVGRRPFISPNVLFTHQGNFNQVNVGAYAGLGQVSGGLWFRHAFGNADAMIFNVGYRKGVIKAGYSYDLTLSRLGNGTSGGAHEISLTFNFDDDKAKRRRAGRRYGECLKIFR